MTRKNLVIAFLLLAFTVTGLVACAKSNDKKPVTPPASDMVVVPNVVGSSYLNAVLEIQKAGFYVKEKGMPPFSTVKDKPVVSQEPAAGTKARKRTPVKLFVK
jgi:beta-lactam-binding protein with PASTA domain